jgi:hypothetical protein
MAEENQISNEKVSLFRRLFKIGIDKDKKAPFPTKLVKDREGLYNSVREQFPKQVDTLLKYWISDCHDDRESFQNRKELFMDMDMIYYNSPFLSRAMNLMADETVQADTNSQIIGVEAEDPFLRDFILEFISRSGIEKYLRSTALNIIQYGNAGWVTTLNDAGIDTVLPVDVFDIKSRLEFTPHQVSKEINKVNSALNSMLSKNEKLRHLVNSIDDLKEDYSTYFKSYLFGFEVGDFVLPPWRFLHFRNFTSKTPFYPFGIPVFIHSVAPFRQYDAAMTLQSVGRGAKFPIDLYKISLPNVMSPTDKIEKVLEFIREFDNSGLRETKKEGIAVGERIITIDGLFTYEQIVPQLDLSDIGDLELLLNALVVSTGLPRNLLDPNNGTFGNSGISLIQQYVPFKRQIFHIQSCLLEQITQLVKIHLVQSGRFPLKDIDFRLTMPYPESQSDRELIGSQSDLVTLANSILDSLQAKLVAQGENLNKDVVTQVYTKILPYPPSDIEKWVDLTMASGQLTGQPAAAPTEEAPAPEAGGGGGESSPLDLLSNEEPAPTGEEEQPPTEETPAPETGEAKESTSRKRPMKKKMNLKEQVESEIYKETKKSFREGTFRGRHFYSSSIGSQDFDVSLLVEWKKEGKQKLSEESESKED